MKKILGLGIAAILILAMVGGGTWAYFVDTETSSGNILTSGTLDLGLANDPAHPTGGSATATWTTPVGFAPGNTLDKTLNVKNSGNIAMSSVNITFSQIYTEGTPSTVSGYNLLGTTTGNLTNMLKASIATWNGTGSALATVFQGDNLTALSGNGTMNLGSLAAGQEAALRIVWLFDTSATNGAEGDSENITLTLTGNQ